MLLSPSISVVVSNEMVPKSHYGCFVQVSTIGLKTGFMLMTVLDNVLG